VLHSFITGLLFAQEFQLGKRNPKSVKVRVAMLSQEWLEANRINSTWSAQSAQNQYKSIQQWFKLANKRENKREKKTHWTVEIRRYSHMPAVHGGMINDNHLLFGTCQWDRNDNLWAGDKPYGLYSRSDGSYGADRLVIFKGWFEMCWKSASDPSILQWKAR